MALQRKYSIPCFMSKRPFSLYQLTEIGVHGLRGHPALHHAEEGPENGRGAVTIPLLPTGEGRVPGTGKRRNSATKNRVQVRLKRKSNYQVMGSIIFVSDQRWFYLNNCIGPIYISYCQCSNMTLPSV